jgi:hypothetical protein
MGRYRESTIITPEEIRRVSEMERQKELHQALFANAFLQQTGLQPDEAEMCYGEQVVDGKPVFKVWFRRQEEGEELQMLREFFGRVCEHYQPLSNDSLGDAQARTSALIESMRQLAETFPILKMIKEQVEGGE